MCMQKTTRGFSLFLILIVIALLAGGYWYKEKGGKTYMESFFDRAQKATDGAKEIQEKMKLRDEDIKKNL